MDQAQKINFDGYLLGNLGPFGIEGIIRDV